MSRDSNGTHTLPTGNPVVSGSAISSTVHNATLTDLSTEITDSLSRSGKGGMSAALLHADGTKTAPGLSFTGDTDTGIYRIGANNLGVSVGDTKILDVASTGLSVVGTISPSGVVKGPNGAVGAPTYSFTGAADAGLYKTTSGVGLALSGALAFEVTGDVDVKTKKVINVGAPSAATDAATKAYAESVTAIVATGTITKGTDWNVASLSARRVGSVVHVTGLATATVGGAVWSSICTLPSGYNPPATLSVVGLVYDADITTYYMGYFTVSDTGVVALANTVGAATPTLATNDQIRLDLTFIV